MLRGSPSIQLEGWTSVLLTLAFTSMLPHVSSANSNGSAIDAADVYEHCCQGKGSGVHESREFVYFLIELKGIDPSLSDQHLRGHAMLEFFNVLREFVLEKKEPFSTLSISDLKMHILRQGLSENTYTYHVAVTQHEITRLRAQ